ncbi:hypothetical protein KDL44_13600 [bacterium]|nr:hypothetical protein [bacterium]
MEIEGEKSDSGLKPGYGRRELGRITTAMLRNRLSRIDNRTAHALARELLGQCLSSGPSSWALSTLAEFVEERPVELSADGHILRLATSARESLSLKILCPQPGYLLGMLEKLRHVSFRDMVLLDPQQLQEEIESANPLVRLLLPLKRLNDSRHIAEYLADNIDRLPRPHRGIPFRLQKLLNIWSPLAGILLIPLFSFWLSIGNVTKLALVPATLLYLICLLCYQSFMTGLIRRRHFQRTLALYISFTDEFVEQT